MLLLALVAGGSGLLVASSLAAAAGPPGQDQAFLREVHQANLVAVSAGRLAQRKAIRDEVRRDGRLFVDDHNRLDAELRALAGRLAVSLPSGPTRAQQQQVAALSALSGPAFDAAWIDQQIEVHRECGAAGRRELASGSDTQVKALARRAGPVFQAHLSILDETARRRTPDAVEAGGGGQSAGRRVPYAPLGLGLVGLAAVLAAGMLLLLAHRRRE